MQPYDRLGCHTVVLLASVVIPATPILWNEQTTDYLEEMADGIRRTAAKRRVVIAKKPAGLQVARGEDIVVRWTKLAPTGRAGHRRRYTSVSHDCLASDWQVPAASARCALSSRYQCYCCCCCCCGWRHSWWRCHNCARSLKALLTATIRLRFDCNSTALRPFDDLRHDRR